MAFVRRNPPDEECTLLSGGYGIDYSLIAIWPENGP